MERSSPGAGVSAEGIGKGTLEYKNCLFDMLKFISGQAKEDPISKDLCCTSLFPFFNEISKGLIDILPISVGKFIVDTGSSDCCLTDGNSRYRRKVERGYKSGTCGGRLSISLSLPGECICQQEGKDV